MLKQVQHDNIFGQPLDFLLTHFELFAFCFMLKPCHPGIETKIDFVV